MQVKNIAECLEHSAILSTFIKLPFAIKTFFLSIFEWPLKTGFTVLRFAENIHLFISINQRSFAVNPVYIINLVIEMLSSQRRWNACPSVHKSHFLVTTSLKLILI